MAGPWEKYADETEEPQAPQATAEGPWTKYSDEREQPPITEPDQQNLTDQGWRGNVAAGLRGVREAIPFARDIGAGVESLRKGVPFSEEKAAQEARDAALAAEHPLSYGAGEIAGGLASIAVPEAAGMGLISKGAKAEAALANKLAPILGSTTEANLVAGLGAGAAAGAGQAALHGLGTGTDLSERIGRAEEEVLPGAALGMAGAGVGHLASRGLRKAGELTGKVEPLPPTPTKEDLLKSGREAYEKSKAQYLHVKTAPVRDLYDTILNAMEEKGYSPEVHTSMKPALRKLRDVSIPQSLEDLDRIRRMTTSAAKNWQKPEDQMMAGIFRRKMDDFLDKLHPLETISKTGKPTDAIEALQEGRQFWRQGKKQQLIEEAFETAKDRAGSTGSGGNLNNAFRQEIKKIYQKAKKQGKLWSPDEMQAMRELVRGGVTANLARPLAVLNPFKHGLVGTFEGLHALTSPSTGWVAPAVGIPAHYLAENLTKSAGQNLRKIVGAGGKKTAIPRINPMESVYGRAAATPATISPAFQHIDPSVLAEDREQRASGGKVGKRDYPAKKLTRMEKALKRAQTALAEETKPIMEMPDQHVAHALEIAKDK